MNLSFTAQAQDNLRLYPSEPDPLEGISPRESDVSFTFLLGNWVFFAFLKKAGRRYGNRSRLSNAEDVVGDHAQI